MLKKLWKDENGQGLVEYSLIVLLVSIAAYLTLQGLGTNINTILGSIRDKLVE